MRPSRRCAVILVMLVIALDTPGPRAETLPDQTIKRAQHRVRRSPGDPGAYLRLGDAYIQKARATGDMSYVDLAEASLRNALALAPAHAGATRHLAYVLASRHEFEAAAAQARRAIELDPKDGDAWGVLGDASLELGAYDRADEAYARMISLKRDLASHARVAALKSLRGDPGGAIDELRRAVASAQATSQPRESIAWAQWQLGMEHLAIGEIEAAEAEFQSSLRTHPGYYRALAGLAQARAAQARDADAVELYRRALAVAPFPEYAAALGDLYAKIGRAEEAGKQYDLVEFLGRLNALNTVLYNRELAYFYADHDVNLEAAVELARSELAWRRDIYGHDVLAWALYKAGRPHEALAAMRNALSLDTRDAKLFFHAGMIHRALGDGARAREYLARALETNPHFHPRQAELAARALSSIAPGAACGGEGAQP